MKILWLALGIPLAIVVITIIANSIPSFDERRRGEISQTPGTPGAKKIFWPIVVIILLALAVIMGIKMTRSHSPLAAYPVAADAQDVWPQIGQTVKIKIYPNCWSGWINLPVDPSGMGSFFVKTPGETEVWFWSGERQYIPDKISPQWFCTIPHRSFRLRGTAGEAEITIQ